MPHDVGSATPRLEELDALVRTHVVEAGAAPAAVVVWARRDARGSWQRATGAAGCAPNGIFDLASVTKPLTALSAMQLIADGVLGLDARLGDVLPELDSAPAAQARLDDLLAHRAGLPPWGALYRNDPWGASTTVSLSPDRGSGRSSEEREVARMLSLAASRIEPRAISFAVPPRYSDLGYVLAGAMIARAARAPLVDCWERLGGATSAARWRARIGSSFDARVLPTEHVPWRGGDVVGVVHDENAFMLERAGGHPGHAGAFATAAQVADIAIHFVDALQTPRIDDVARTPMLPRALCEAMIAPRPDGSHLLGWDGVTRGASSSGTRFGPRSFGHLGFTGTSVWADPDAGAVAVLLTNRTYPSRDNVRIRLARPRIHDALWSIDPTTAI